MKRSQSGECTVTAPNGHIHSRETQVITFLSNRSVLCSTISPHVISRLKHSFTPHVLCIGIPSCQPTGPAVVWICIVVLLVDISCLVLIVHLPLSICGWFRNYTTIILQPDKNQIVHISQISARDCSVSRYALNTCICTIHLYVQL